MKQLLYSFLGKLIFIIVFICYFQLLDDFPILSMKQLLFNYLIVILISFFFSIFMLGLGFNYYVSVIVYCFLGSLLTYWHNLVFYMNTLKIRSNHVEWESLGTQLFCGVIISLFLVVIGFIFGLKNLKQSSINYQDTETIDE